MKTADKIKEQEIRVVYTGMNIYDSHTYIEMENQENQLSFSKKLYKEHKIGLVYSIIRVGDDKYRLMKDNLEPVGKWKKSTEVARWIKSDTAAHNAIKAKRERGKLATLSRKAVHGLRPAYKRADFYEQCEMLRAIVEELEKP